MKNIIIIIAIFIALILWKSTRANSFFDEVDLRGNWNFSIGDNPDWLRADFNDSEWESIYVPERWEEQGYQGYNGFAWYRKSFEIPASFKQRVVYAELGYIDDVDEVFFNGIKVGQSGSFPPHFSTAYNAFRRYSIPTNLIRFDGKNTLAIRTYDAQLEGGIVRGEIRLVANEIAIELDINLNGLWDFQTQFNEKGNHQIIVPGQWENQGYYNYDGFAIYTKNIEVPANLSNQKLVFMAGRIDDDDQLFINGTLVGQTGDINRSYNTEMHREFRNYFIPDGIVKPGKNKIEIKVIDRGGEGGILEGNIGLITQSNFIKYWRMKRSQK